MAQSLPQLFTVATSTPQLILVRVGRQLQQILIATGTPSPHHQMAQSLPQFITVVTSTQVSHQNREVVIRYGYLGNTSTQRMWIFMGIFINTMGEHDRICVKLSDNLY
jgi:hypothetical protein